MHDHRMVQPLPERDPLRPHAPRGMGKGLALAIAVHSLLIVGLAIGVNWRISAPATVTAELWSAVPQVAAPKAVEPPPPPPPEPAQPRPQPKPEPAPPPEPPRPDPQIAIEKAKREEALRRQQEAEQREAERRAAEKKAREREDAERRQKEAEAKKRQQQEDQRLAELRQKNLERIRGLAESAGEPSSTGTAQRNSGGPSSGYGDKVYSAVFPNIIFNQSVEAEAATEVSLRLAPDGRILSATITKRSGYPQWDEAVLRAFDRTVRLPRDVDGTVPSTMLITMRPQKR